MKRVLFLTTYASPYRVQFFDALGESCDVTVLFSDRADAQKHRDAKWFVSGNGKAKFVQLSRQVGSLGKKAFCVDVLAWLKKPFDAIVVCGYSSPTFMLAIAYLKSHRIPFYMEVDGGLVRQDSKLKRWYKRQLVGSAGWWLSTGKATDDYLAYYGADRSRMLRYPFSSLKKEDIREDIPSAAEKRALREKLGIQAEQMILSVGRMDLHGKGLDVLLKSAASLPEGAEVWLVGDEPTEEIRALEKELRLKNIHYVGFCKKDALAEYYRAADVLVMPTRSDVWGLVINEAMACGLPVIGTDRCVAAMELVENGVNGYVVPAGDAEALSEKLCAILHEDLETMGRASLKKIRPYTIENMAHVHQELLNL